MSEHEDPALFRLLVDAVRDAEPGHDCEAERLQGHSSRPAMRRGNRYLGGSISCDEHAPPGSVDLDYAPALRAVMVLLEHCPPSGSRTTLG